MDTMENFSSLFIWGTRGGCPPKLVGRPKDMEHKKHHVGEKKVHNIKNITQYIIRYTYTHINNYG